MQRPAGVIVSGVIAILGSLLCLLMGGLMLLVLPGSMEQAQVQNLPRGFIYLPMAMILGLGVWGLNSGIGLLALRNWARISTLIFAGVLATLAVMSLPMMFLMPMMPPDRQIDDATMRLIQMMLVSLYLGLGLLGVSWLVYFNRAQLKEAFRRGVPEAPPNPNPLSIRIVGWFLVTSAPCGLLILFWNIPIVLGTQVFTGRAATIIFLIWSLLFFATGVGLLRLQRWSHIAAMCMFGLGILNATIFWLQPDAKQKMEELSRAMLQSMSMRASQQPQRVPPVGFSIAVGLLSAALPLSLLIHGRKKFLAAADAKNNQPPN